MINFHWYETTDRQLDDQLTALASTPGASITTNQYKSSSRPLTNRQNRRKKLWLGGFINQRLATWIELTANPLHSNQLGKPVFYVTEELLQNNSVQLRNSVLKEIIKQHSNSFIFFSQPADCKKTINFYQQQPQLSDNGCDIYMSKSNPGLPLKKTFSSDQYFTVTGADLKRKQLTDLIAEYNQSRLHTNGPYNSSDTQKIFQAWIQQRFSRERGKLIGLTCRSELVGIILVDLTGSKKQSKRPTGQLLFLQIKDSHQGAGLGNLLLHRGEAWLKSNQARQINLRVNKKNNGARKFYQQRGYSEISRYRRFVFIPHKFHK